MKKTKINSAHAPCADGGYSQAILTQEVEKYLFVSGQIPETKTGETPDDFEAQCRLVWSNVLSQLETAGMGIENLVKVTTFLSSREYAETNSRIRQEILGDSNPALTIIITEIYDEKWLLEIEAMAAS